MALVERFLLADVQAELPLPRDTVAVWLRGQDMLAAFPLPGADLWRLMAPGPPTAGGPAQDLTGDAVLDALTGLLEVHAGYPAGVVRGAQWTSTFRFHRRLAALTARHLPTEPPDLGVRVLAAAALATLTTALITWVDGDGAEDLPELVDRVFAALRRGLG